MSYNPLLLNMERTIKGYRALKEEMKRQDEEVLEKMSYSTMLAKIKDGVYNTTIKYSKETRLECREELIKLEKEFKKDLFKAYDVEDNPKREKAYALAYEHGHALGFSEILNYFHDFVDLIK